MNSEVSTQVRNKNRRRLILIVLVFCMPLIVAWFVLKNIDTLKPSGSRNYGELVQPARPLTDFELQQMNTQKFTLADLKGKWNFFYFAGSACSEICQQTIAKIHQARLGQGKAMSRLRHFYVKTDSTELNQQTKDLLTPLTDFHVLSGNAKAIQALMAQFKATGYSPEEAGRIFLVDPHGNIMMTYTRTSVLRDLLKDLEQLLKYSQIG